MRWRVLRAVQRSSDRGHADAGTEHKAPDDEGECVRAQCLEQCPHDEDGGSEQDRRPAPVALGQRTRGQGSGHGTEGDPARDDLDHEGAGVERLVDPRQGTRNDALVVTEQETGQHHNEADRQ